MRLSFAGFDDRCAAATVWLIERLATVGFVEAAGGRDRLERRGCEEEIGWRSDSLPARLFCDKGSTATTGREGRGDGGDDLLGFLPLGLVEEEDE